MENTLDILSMKMCSPMVVFFVFVIVSGVSLFMSRNVLKRYSNQRMENLYNLKESHVSKATYYRLFISELFDDKKHKQKIIKYFASYTQPFESIHEFDDRGKYLNTLRKTGCNRTLKYKKIIRKNKLTFQREIVNNARADKILAFYWLWHRQLLRHEKLRWVWRRIRVGRLCYCYCCVAPLETAFYLHKLFSELLIT